MVVRDPVAPNLGTVIFHSFVTDVFPTCCSFLITVVV